MKALLYQIHLNEPLLATQPHSGEPNSAVSYPFIPGSMVRGALVRAYLLQHPVSDPADDPPTRKLFFDGQVRYLNAYPAVLPDMTRLLPTPLSWYVEKNEADDWGATIYDLAAKGGDRLENPQTPKGSYTLLSGGFSQRLQPRRQVTVHNTSQDRSLKRQGSSQVYQYDALAAGQTFTGVIIAEDALAAELDTISLLLPEVKTLGGSATGGYGRVTVTVNGGINDDWQEYEEEPGDTDSVVLTFLSDALLGQDNGDYLSAIEQLAGARPRAVFARERLVGGFNRKWGLPLPQQWALVQGSVFVFDAAEVKIAQLRTWTETGVGDRTIDGFGRVAINWHGRPEYESVQLVPPRLEEPQALHGASQDMAQRLLRHHLLQRLEQGLVNALDMHTIRLRNLPSATQLSRARVAARHALLRRDLTLISKHLDNLKGAKQAWQEAKFNNATSLFKWVKAQCALSEEEFTTTFLRGNPLPTLANQEAKLTEEVRTEYVARYIDGVLKQAVEQAKAERRGVSHG